MRMIFGLLLGTLFTLACAIDAQNDQIGQAAQSQSSQDPPYCNADPDPTLLDSMDFETWPTNWIDEPTFDTEFAFDTFLSERNPTLPGEFVNVSDASQANRAWGGSGHNGGNFLVYNGFIINDSTPSETALVWCKDFANLEVDTDYAMQSWVANVLDLSLGPNVPVPTLRWEVYVDGILQQQSSWIEFDRVFGDPIEWSPLSFSWSSASRTEASFCLRSKSNLDGTANDFGIDDVAICKLSVPPTTSKSIYLPMIIR